MDKDSLFYYFIDEALGLTIRTWPLPCIVPKGGLGYPILDRRPRFGGAIKAANEDDLRGGSEIFRALLFAHCDRITVALTPYLDTHMLAEAAPLHHRAKQPTTSTTHGHDVPWHPCSPRHPNIPICKHMKPYIITIAGRFRGQCVTACKDDQRRRQPQAREDTSTSRSSVQNMHFSLPTTTSTKFSNILQVLPVVWLWNTYRRNSSLLSPPRLYSRMTSGSDWTSFRWSSKTLLPLANTKVFQKLSSRSSLFESQAPDEGSRFLLV